jgi:hypothetical protein
MLGIIGRQFLIAARSELLALEEALATNNSKTLFLKLKRLFSAKQMTEMTLAVAANA